MNQVRKITNISSASVPIDIDQNTRVFLVPNGVMENQKVHNLSAIRQFCKVEEDLTEVNPLQEGRQYLRG